MGEQSWSRITIGGSLPARHLEALIEALDEDFYEKEALAEDELTPRLGAIGTDDLGTIDFTGLCSWGNPEDTMALCQKHGLHYVRSFEGVTGVYDHGICAFEPGWKGEDEIEADSDGVPTFTLQRLRRAKPHDTITDIIASVDHFDPIKVPPLVLTVAKPEQTMPCASYGDELMRAQATFFPKVTRVRAIDGSFEGEGTLLAWGEEDGRIMTEVLLDTARTGDWKTEKSIEPVSTALEVIAC